MPQDLINAKPLTVSLKDFFASSQLISVHGSNKSII